MLPSPLGCQFKSLFIDYVSLWLEAKVGCHSNLARLVGLRLSPAKGRPGRVAKRSEPAAEAVAEAPNGDAGGSE